MHSPARSSCDRIIYPSRGQSGGEDAQANVDSDEPSSNLHRLHDGHAPRRAATAAEAAGAGRQLPALLSRVRKQTIADWGETVFASSPTEFGKFLAAENEKWGKLIRAAHIKL